MPSNYDNRLHLPMWDALFAGGGSATEGTIISSEVLAVAGAGYCGISKAAEIAQGVPSLRGSRGEAGE